MIEQYGKMVLDNNNNNKSHNLYSMKSVRDDQFVYEFLKGDQFNVNSPFSLSSIKGADSRVHKSNHNQYYQQLRHSQHEYQKSSPFIMKNHGYQQEDAVDIKSPLEQNLRNSIARSYTSEQYPGCFYDDKNINEMSRRTNSYFPTSKIINHQHDRYHHQNNKYNHPYYNQSTTIDNNSRFPTLNPFSKSHHNNNPKNNHNNFDLMSSSKSSSRLKQMNQKIDQTTKFIMRNGLKHSNNSRQKDTFRMSSKGRLSSKEKRYESKERQNIMKEYVFYASPRNSSKEMKHNNNIERPKVHFSLEKNKLHISRDKQQQANQHLTNNHQKPFNFNQQQKIHINSSIAQNNNIFPKSTNELNNFQYLKEFQNTKSDNFLHFDDNLGTYKDDQIFQYINKQGMIKQKPHLLRSAQDLQLKNMINSNNGQMRCSTNKQPNHHQHQFLLPSTDRKDITFNFIKKDTQPSSRKFIEKQNHSLTKQQHNNNILLESYNKNLPARESSRKKEPLNYTNQFSPRNLIVLNKSESRQKIFNNKNLRNSSSNLIYSQGKNLINYHNQNQRYSQSQVHRNASDRFSQEDFLQIENNNKMLSSTNQFNFIMKKTQSQSGDVEIDFLNDQQQQPYQMNFTKKSIKNDFSQKDFGGRQQFMTVKNIGSLRNRPVQQVEDVEFKQFENDNDEFQGLLNGVEYGEDIDSLKKEMKDMNNFRLQQTHSSQEIKALSKKLNSQNSLKLPQTNQYLEDKTSNQQKPSFLSQYRHLFKDKEGQLIAIVLIILASITLILQILS